MSTLYNLEPPPTAKVILYTTSGDISLELFAQQTPLASRNFLQLCLDSYYDNTLFHRLVPGFIIQGGDPTGTGSGGNSAYDGGRPFADEFHSRLKFNRRGLLGMANGGKDDNGSQFFITLDKTEELQGRNTMFGRVEGQTIFNVLKMGEADLIEGEASDRPLYPTMIKSTEIVLNPFEEMVKRVVSAPTTVEKPEPIRKRPKKKLGKQMLSFGDAEEESTRPMKVAKFNPQLVSADNDPISRPSRPSPPKAAVEKRKSRPISPSPPVDLPPAPAERPMVEKPLLTQSPSRSPTPESDRQAALLNRTNESISNLTRSLKRSQPAVPAHEPVRKKTALEAMIPATSTRGRRRGGAASAKDEKRALDEFNAFKLKLEAAGEQNEGLQDRPTHDEETMKALGGRPPQDGTPNPSEATNADDEDEANLCDLHFVPNCASCRAWDDAEDDQDDATDGLIAHTLSFAKDRLGKDLEWKRQNEKELVVIDPREREKEFKAERKKDRRK